MSETWYNMIEKKLLSKKISYSMFGFFGFLFVFFGRTEKELADWGNILWTSGYVWRILLISLLLGGALGCAVAFILYGFAENRWPLRFFRRAQTERKAGPWKRPCLRIDRWKPGTVFWVSLSFIVLSWLPVYLAYYPGICAYDAPQQTGQAMENYMIDHHPIAHTLLVKAAIVFGKDVLGNVNAGIAVYTFLQMLLLAASMAYAVMILHRLRTGTGWKVAVLLYCMVYPFHWFMSVSMTKDTVFSSFVLLLLTTLSVILLEDRNELQMGRWDLPLAVSCVGVVLFRNNGKYAFAVLLFFLLLGFWGGRARRRLWGRLMICCGGAFAAGLVLLAVLFRVTDAEQGDRREMLSMPIQQLARAMIYHGGAGVLPEDDNTMDESEKALINDFLLNEAYRLYQPEISDPVKRHTNTYVVRYRSGDFVRTYLGLLGQYPGDFINAGLALDAGYLSPLDISHANVNTGEGVHNLGYVQTRWEEATLNARGIYKDSKWESLYQTLEQWSEDNAYLKLPVLKYLFVPGTWLYLYLLLFGWLMLRRDFRLCLSLSLVAGYYLTLFLGPTVQLRYIYPVMIAWPFLALIYSRRAHND